MLKRVPTQEYLDEFSRRDLAGWTAFQSEVLAAGETANGPMVDKRWMGILAAYSEQMRALTEKWYKDSMKARNNWAARDFGFQGKRESEKKKVILDERLFRKVPMFSEGRINISGMVFRFDGGYRYGGQ